MLNLSAEVIVGDNRETLKRLPEQSVQTVVTSPPYWGLRDYGEGDQIGLEPTPDEFVEQLCLVFDEVWRVLKDDGTLWLNLGDSYFGSWGNYGGENRGKGTQRQIVSGSHAPQQAYKELTKWRPPTAGKVEGIKPKDLVGIPWRVAFALQARGWYLRSDIIWHKPNPMPESVTDRPTKSHEYIFLLTKSPRYYYNHEAIKEDSIWANDARAGAGRIAYDGKRQGNAGEGQEAFVTITDKKNKRTVWTVNTKPYKDAHFATYPPELIEPCILAGSGEGDIVLDPFSGSGTTGEMALKHGRNYIGLELNPEYATLSEKRLTEAGGMFAAVKITKGTQC
jgi:DNA modification methylase